MSPDDLDALVYVGEHEQLPDGDMITATFIKVLVRARVSRDEWCDVTDSEVWSANLAALGWAPPFSPAASALLANQGETYVE
jgi:hypothetical protein